ncbi:MAG: polyhydroxyalkanoic acid system family protein [Pirellulales bacterium]|nr:polyhydroxyalkanoic acid system family protein [Pirellulales bacterium]
MPKLSFAVPHSLTREEASARLKSLLERAKAKNPDTEILEENLGETSGTFAVKAKGFKVSGGVEIEDDKVQVNLDLPFTLMMFKGRIESEIRGAAERALSAEA